MFKTENAVAWRLDEALPKGASSTPQARADLFLDFCQEQGVAAGSEIERLYDGELLFQWEGYRQLQDKATKVVPNTAPARPTAEIGELPSRLSEKQYTHLGNERFAFVGYGAGTIIMASYFAARGADPKNMTILDPVAVPGGLWNREWVRSGGFNNPKALAFYRQRLQLADRSGARMLDYLHGITLDHLRDSQRIFEPAVAVKKSHKDDAWRVQTAYGATHEADYVVLATGMSHPRRIDSGRIYSNLDEVAASPYYRGAMTLERHQRRLTDQDFKAKRPFVIMGLGNSTASMLRQIQAYEDATGESVDYTVLTDWSRDAVNNPGDVVERGKSIYRKPGQGYLTGYSGDLDADRWAYQRALMEKRIVSDVHTVYLNGRGELVAQTTDHSEMRRSQAHVFALLGYERDMSLFRSAGALTKGLLRKEATYPAIRPCDGAVGTHGEGYMSNLFAVGTAAAGPGNLAAATIPGIQGQTIETMLTVAARSYAKKV